MMKVGTEGYAVVLYVFVEKSQVSHIYTQMSCEIYNCKAIVIPAEINVYGGIYKLR